MLSFLLFEKKIKFSRVREGSHNLQVNEFFNKVSIEQFDILVFNIETEFHTESIPAQSFAT